MLEVPSPHHRPRTSYDWQHLGFGRGDDYPYRTVLDSAYATHVFFFHFSLWHQEWGNSEWRLPNWELSILHSSQLLATIRVLPDTRH